jgi:cysteine-rich repeat protein
MTRVLCRALLLACLMLAGCLRAATAECDNGSVCPAGFRCAGPDVGRRCILASCGNDRIDPGEACDDGNNVSGDGCPADCSEPCGDGHLDPGEACDDDNAAGGDGCSADCRSREVCGNGVVDPNEVCDDDNQRSRDGCSSQCTIESPTWSPIDLAPPGRHQYAMVYDAARGVAVLFGGRGSNNELFNDTWEWNGVTWRLRDTSTVPPGRAQHAMAYDAGRRRIVMFGGEGPGDNSTWEFDGVDWIERLPAVAPPPLVNASMVYDAGRRQVVLFGGRGRDAVGDLVDMDRTWVWRGESWQAIVPVSAPPGRSQHAMAYDGKRDRIVLFGGAAGPFAMNDTWTFDGTSWTLQSIISPPRARTAHTMAFDSARGTVMMFGGGAPSVFELVNDTWEWDGSTWTQRAAGPAPSPRQATAMIYDLARDKLVLFSGKQLVDGVILNLPTDTWEWSGGTWVKHAVGSSVPAPRQGHGMAYNPGRKKVVLFGGSTDSFGSEPLGDTWDWDGMNWESEVHVVTPTAPSLRSKFAMTTVNNGVFLFGGSSNGSGGMNDTWSLGDQWNLLRGGPSQTASPRRLSAIAYDAGHHQVVLFGGIGAGSNALSDTLVWNVPGVDWVPITPAHSPPARFGHTMAYDSKRGRVMLFGGVESLSLGGTVFNDTWEWDGADWTPLTPATAPPPRWEHAMVYDSARDRLVMFGGDAGLTRFSDTWEWDGADWQLQISATVPPERRAHAMAYDQARSRTVMFGGDEGHGEITTKLLNDAWEWDGVDWHRVAFSATPPGRTGHAMAYDDRHGATLMFGGQDLELAQTDSTPRVLGDTWVWSGVSWQQQQPAVSPPPRVQHAMAFDSARGRAVLFGGGVDGGGYQMLGDDTWEWSAGTWLARTPANRPPARRGHAMVYDAARGKTLLFGGDGPGSSADHWEWDGTDWMRVIPPLVPPIRSSFAMAYDAERQTVVLFGGRDTSGALADVWEWDGTTWSDRTPLAGPAPKPRTNHTLVYSTARRRVLLFGGLLFNDLWEWDGMAWTQLLPTDSPLPREGHAMVCDAARGELVLFGGDRGGSLHSVLGDTWVFQFEDLAPPVEACRTGLDGDNDDKIGCADPDCGGLCARCGDRVCDPLESCRLCPEDCGACNVCGDLVCDPTEGCTSCPGDCGTCRASVAPRR